MSVRARLKSATAPAHERVDAAFAHFDLSDAASYGEFLARHAAALLPIEAALDEAGADRLIAEWDGHRRAPLLIQDLHALGVAADVPVEPSVFCSDAELAGGLYVLEGSRLGGAFLRRAVAPGLPTAFLGAPQSRGRWSHFTASLDSLLHESSHFDAALKAALSTFACFERAAAPVPAP